MSTFVAETTRTSTRRVFDEPTRSTFVLPALADFQHELQDAGARPISRLIAHVRGYAAFARLLLAATVLEYREAKNSVRCSLTKNDMTRSAPSYRADRAIQSPPLIVR